MEFDKFDTEPYIKTMKTEIEISYPKDIVDIIKSRKAYVKVQVGSSNVQVEPKSVTWTSLYDPVLCLHLKLLSTTLL